MTATPRNPRVTELRELFRQLIALRSVFEETETAEIISPEGNTWSLWDLEYLFAATARLTLRQRQAITLCLVHGMREQDAAVAMGVSPTNPVSMYASLGLQRLLDMLDAGELVRYSEQVLDARQLRRRHFDTVVAVGEHIQKRLITMQNGCWLYPTTCAGEPLLLLRSPHSPLGYVGVSPVEIMYRIHRGTIPRGCTYQHVTRIQAMSLDCVNPGHFALQLSAQRRREVQSLALKWNREKQRRDRVQELLHQWMNERVAA